MPKQKNKNLSSTRHAESVFKLLKFVEEMIHELESHMQNNSEEEGLQKRWKHVFGDKENIISVLIKLTGILVKIIPMEQDIMKVINKDNESKINDLSEEDVEIIKRYLQKVKDEEQEGEYLDISAYKFKS